MNTMHRHDSARSSFDYFRVSASCTGCGRTDDAHTIRTWWSAPNRTQGWDAPTTSGATLAVGATLPRLGRTPTDYRGESRCSSCGRSFAWAIRSARGRVLAIRPAARAA